MLPFLLTRCSFELANDFYFTVADTLTQCDDFSFTLYQGAIKPLTIFVRFDFNLHLQLLRITFP